MKNIIMSNVCDSSVRDTHKLNLCVIIRTCMNTNEQQTKDKTGAETGPEQKLKQTHKVNGVCYYSNLDVTGKTMTHTNMCDDENE